MSSLKLSVQGKSCVLTAFWSFSLNKPISMSSVFPRSFKNFILRGGNIRASCSKELSALLFPHVFVFNDLTDHLCHSVRYDLLYLKDGKLEMRWPTWACAWSMQPHLLIAPSRHSAQEVLPCRGEGCRNSVCEYGSPQRSSQGSPALKSSWAKGGNREAAALRPGICTAIQVVLILST